MNILLTGATGFIGRDLVALLTSQGHVLNLISRTKPIPSSVNAPGLFFPANGLTSINWFTWSEGDAFPEPALADVDAVIHLAGENIGSWPWTASRKHRICESRVARTRELVDAMSRQTSPPKIFLAASAMGYYGNAGANSCVESDLTGKGFLAELVTLWETEIFKAQAFGARTVALRTGIVLGGQWVKGRLKLGGALAKMAPAFQFGLGSIMGNGDQYWSWLHLEDLVGILSHALRNADMSGAINACAPEPVTQGDFSRYLATALRRPLILRVPAWMLRLVLGGMADTLLEGQRGDCRKLIGLGYHFRYPSLPKALTEIFTLP
jgi:uncharacterized protein